MFTRRRLAALLLAALGPLGATCAQTADPYPAKPIKLIVPYAAGQGTDIAARYLAEELGKELGKPLYIDNKPGAGGNIGTQAAATSPADGYTLVIGTNATHAANGFLYSQPGYNAETDFEPIAMVGILPLVFVTAPNNPLNSVAELVKAAKDKPDALNIAVSTTTCRIAYELLKAKAGAPMFPVDFKGSAQSMTAVMGGHVQYMVDTITSLRPAIDAKSVKPLGVTSAHESKLLPGVKSVAEQGIEGYELVGWTVMYAPKGLPPEVSRTLSTAMNKVLARTAVQDKLLQLGIEPVVKTGADLKAFHAAEKEKWGKLIKGAGLTAG
jgi:tripartite-type tricarboxylate transporter receptor subunit TctC